MKNGFTLIELLGVIIILFLIAGLVFPAVTKIINSSNDTVYQAQINSILKSAYDLTLKNTEYLPLRGEKKYITLGELKSQGLIGYSVKDPKTKKEFADNLVISVEYLVTKKSYDKKYSKLEGNYLYTVEMDSLQTNTTNPSINIAGLTKNSLGDYVMSVSLNDAFTLPSVTATSSSSVDLTDRVKYYITLDDVLVPSVSTNEFAIYKIKYFVVDDLGKSQMSTLSVIIADTTPPEITLPTNDKISTSTSRFDLMEGVTCTDNSGFCNITYTGSITYGTVGKYIIEYTGQDKSGNTTVIRRVITVE